jgi:signal transduction histidine kinase
MTRLVEDLLFVSKIEAGALRVHLEEVDLAASVEGTIESLGQRERARIRADMQTADGPVRIDPDKTGQILRNLLGNALKFSPPGSPVDLGARVDDGHVELSVSDRGVGIASDDLPFIFDRFHQASKVLTRTAEGAGLGLYITRRLIEALGGTIEVRSAPGSGSTFTVRLPQGEIVDPAVESIPSSDAPSRGRVSTSPIRR